MKAWRLFGFKDHRLVEVPVPEVVDKCVLVKVKVVQPSVTDTEIINGDAVADSSRLLPKWFAEGKRVQMGHEFCGEVVGIGNEVTSLKVGERVSSGGAVYCGSCHMCLSGRHSECLSLRYIGGDIPGAFAEYMCIPEQGVVKIPDGPTDNEVATLQPLAASVRSVAAAEIKMGDTVVVLGQGSIGLGILQAAKLAGAGLLIAVARRAENLDLSRRYGANYTINTKKADVVKEVRRLTDGSGADIVFDAAGGSPKYGLSGFESVQQAFQIVRRGGKVVESAVLTGTLELEPVFMNRNGISWINPWSARGRYVNPYFEDGINSFLKLATFWVASGRIQIGPQITHVLHGLEKLSEAIEITANKGKYGAINPAQVVV